MSTNKLNSEGNREGLWVVYWRNGNLWHKGSYLNGKEVGFNVRYWASGKLMSRGFYVN